MTRVAVCARRPCEGDNAMRMWTAVIIGGGALASAALLGVSSVEAMPNPGLNPSKFVGTALSEITFNDGMTVTKFPSIGTLHADGTINVSDGEDFLPGAISAIDGVARGSWEMIGPDTLKGVTIYHAFDDAGVLVFTARNDFQLTLVDGQPHDAEGFGTGRIYFPGTDPLDVGAGLVVGTFTMTSRRLHP